MIDKFKSNLKEAKWWIMLGAILGVLESLVFLLTPSDIELDLLHLIYNFLGIYTEIILPLIFIVLIPGSLGGFLASFLLIVLLNIPEDNHIWLIWLSSIIGAIFVGGLHGYLLFLLFKKVTLEGFKKSLKKAKIWVFAGALWGLLSSAILFYLITYKSSLYMFIYDIYIAHIILPGMYFLNFSESWVFISSISLLLGAIEGYIVFHIVQSIKKLIQNKKAKMVTRRNLQ